MLFGFWLSDASRLSRTLPFFIYDPIKILLLLFCMIVAIGFVRSFISQSKIKRWISGQKVLANCYAAFLNAVTPFCSRSSIPIFLSFLEAGIPLGVTLSFLGTPPLINKYPIIVILGFLGWKITFLYIISGLFIGIFSGIILGHMGLERYLIEGFSASSKKPRKNIQVP